MTLILIVVFANPPREILIFQTWLAILGSANAIITRFWKISGHMLAITSLALWLTLLVHPLFVLCFITLVPLIGWARLRKQKHTYLQLVGGFVLACLLIIPFIWMVY